MGDRCRPGDAGRDRHRRNGTGQRGGVTGDQPIGLTVSIPERHAPDRVAIAEPVCHRVRPPGRAPAQPQ